MKLVYIAGPYRAALGRSVEQNIRAARRMGIQVVAQCIGCYPVIPHMNTANFDLEEDLVMVGDQFYLDGSMALMRKCDAVLLVYPDAMQDSVGTRHEVETATVRQIPVFTTLHGLKQWSERPDLRLK